jgi:uncharacterized membrane protein
LPRWATVGGSVLLYSLYPVVVCIAFASGRPRVALATTCLALGILLVTLRGWRVPGIILLAAVPMVLLSAVGAMAQPLVFVPPIALNLALAFLFGRSLRAGHEPLISTFARMERGKLEPDLAHYTRALTGVWVAFFVGAAVLSALLAATAPPAVWGWFVAVGNQVAVAVLFVGEYGFRRLRFPQYQHASPFALALIVARQWRAQPAIER